MKNALMQARVVTDPVKNSLIGWWCEFYLFYVKHRDLADREEFQNMVLQGDWSASSAGVTDATDDPSYYHIDGINWPKLCLQRVVEEYFRDEGEAWDAYTIDGLPSASISGNSWLDSVTDQTTVEEGGDPSGATTVEALDIMMQQYEFMKANQLINMSYEDFLRTYGVRLPNEENNRPELIRYVKDWQYPSNTIDPSSGAPSSAVSWAIAERADKDRFFKEPGFIFGVQVVRPKVYLSKQKQHASSMLDNAFAWLPAVFREEKFTSLREYANTAGPLQGNVTNGYWVDLRDLYVYGDQFVNYTLDTDGAGLVGLPTAALNKRFPVEADADDLFVDDEGSATTVETDGVASFSILGTTKDWT